MVRFGSVSKDVEQAAIVGETGSWVADGEVANLFERALHCQEERRRGEVA